MFKVFSLSAILAGAVFAQGTPFSGNVVAGAPYSAEVVNEVVAAAGSGQSPSSMPIGHVYRDSAGRTRTERPALSGQPDGAQTIVEINDPVGGVRYRLDQENKIAHLQRMPPLASLADPRLAGIMGMAPNMTPPPPPAGLVGAGPGGGPPGIGGMPAGKMAQPDVMTEKLGTQMIDGISAEGTRRTTTLPAGLQGDAPIVTVSESWFSPELKVTMLTKDSDPRLGDRITKLVNVQRTEPSAALFAPGSDYKVVEDSPAPAAPRK